MKVLNNKEVWLFVYILFLIVFWRLSIIPRQDDFAFICSIPLCLYAIQDRNKNLKFKKYIVALFICLGINIFFCYINRGQAPYWTFRDSYMFNFFPILLYFYLIRRGYTLLNMEKILSILYLSTCFCYIFQYMIYPYEVFQQLDLTPNEKRFRLCGQAIVSLGYFYFLSKYVLYYNFKYLLYMLIGLSIFILMGFRSMLAAIFIVSLFLTLRITNFSIRRIVPYILLAVVIGLIMYQFEFVQFVVKNMLERNEEANFGNEDYIRVLEYEYFMNDHFVNLSDYIFGSGFPTEHSSYGRQMLELRQFNQYGEYTSSVGAWVDWGLLGLSWVAGMHTVIVLLLISFTAIFLKVEKKYYFVSAFYIFLLLSSITTVEFFRQGAFVIHALALYLLELAHKQYRINYVNRNSNTTIKN